MLITITDDMAPRLGPATNTRLLGPVTTTKLSPVASSPSSLHSKEGERRLRILRLVRPRKGSYGFHLRGGREHGTGFFISHVEPGTEAFSQGLRTGDQVLRVNDLNVNGALHKEVAAIVMAGSEVILHVKSTGLIPVKDQKEDPLSWVLVDQNDGNDSLTDPSGYQSSISSTGTNKSSKVGNPVTVVVPAAGKQTLGCSICAGPSEKPGIFVQHVQDKGVAYKSGLRAGDQILSCNGKSFLKTDFRTAIESMKKSISLNLEVARGAGLDLIAGESSGYNSSASSETSEERYSPSESYSRDGYSNSSLSSTLKRLHCIGIGDRIQLDSNRDWKEIEAEWEDAEVSEKRSQLETSQNILSRKINQKRPSVSKSFVNLTINEVDEEPVNRQPSNHKQITIAPTCNTCSHLNTSSLPQNKKSSLSKPKSMIDLRPTKNDNSYKIAMQMSDAHVSKIVIPSAPKDTQNALLRLDELSAGVKNSHMMPSKGLGTLQTHTKTGSISSTSSEESTYNSHHNHPLPGLGASLKESRQLLRCRSVPQDTNSLSDSDSVLSFPSSTISICKTGSGRFTSKVHIRNAPPPPPPRGNSTKLSRQQRKLKCEHLRQLECPHHPSSPSTSPCISSCNSGENVSYNSGFPRRQSLESLSISSEESAPWDESERRKRVTIISPISSSNTLPPQPPPPPSSSIPPPPPPPPTSFVPSSQSTFASQILSRQQEIKGATFKLKSQEERTEAMAKKPPPDPKKMQHEMLMEEFKKAHALMVAKRQANTSSEISSS